MAKHTLRYVTGGLTIAFAMALQPGSSLADSSKPPTPTLHGPSSVSTSQPFNLGFSYPKGEVKSYALEFFHCRPGTNARPSDDSKTEPWPVQGCEPALTTTPSAISPDSGQVSVDVKYGVTAIHQYNTKDYSAADTAQWLQGHWYVRARLISTSGVQGSWSSWHHTLVGSANIGKPIGIKGALADRSRPATAIVMRGLAPPVVAAPAEGQVFHGNVIGNSVTLPAHARYADWSCCEIQWQRAAVVTAENEAGGFPTARAPWNKTIGLYGGYSPTIESGPSIHGAWSFDMMRPHSRKIGYRYWFRIREHYSPGNASGPWSAWRSFIVQEPAIKYSLPHASAPSLPGQSAQKPGAMRSVNPRLNPQPEPPSPSAPRLQLPAK